MSFLVGVINAVKKGKKAIKNLKLGVRAAKSSVVFLQQLKGFFLGFLKGLLFYILIAVLVISILIGGIEAVFSFFKNKLGDNFSPTKASTSITEKEKKEIIDDGSPINPKKFKDYANVEDTSYPKSVKTKMTTIDDGVTKTSDYTLNLTKTSYDYRTPWQLVAGLDVTKDIYQDENDTSVCTSAKTSLAPSFEWGYDKYTKDVTDSRKEWVVETTQEKDSNGNLKGKSTEVKNTESSARQIDVTKKYPLPFADSVTTSMKKYTYHFTLDKVTKDDPWSSAIRVGKPKEWDEQIQDGTEDDKSKPIYEDDPNSPIYGDDTSKPIYENVTYNRFKIYGEWDENKQWLDIRASINGNSSFSGDQWFVYSDSQGDYYRFIDNSVYGNGAIISVPKYSNINSSTEFFYKTNIVKNEWTGKYKQKKIGDGKKLIGYEQKPKYKTVHHIEINYKKTKQKIAEDQISYVDEMLDPQPLLNFTDTINISKDDLALVHDCLENMPDSSEIVADMQSIIDGNYLNSGVNATGGGVDASGLTSDIPLFIQWDKRWGTIPYGSSGTIGSSGCGPTSMAMVMTGLGANTAGIDKNGDGWIDPSETAAYSVSNGFRTEGVGTSWSFFNDIGTKGGLKVTQVGIEEYAKVLQHLKNGNPVIASMGPGTFTKGGHFIVLTGVDDKGNIKVNDPNSPERSAKTWAFESIIVAEARQFWLIENPNQVFKTFLATAYDLSYQSCQKNPWDKGYGSSASGFNLAGQDISGKYIAVDSSLIKLGTYVTIKFPAGKDTIKTKDGRTINLNGKYKAVDTGGGIKGYHIDVYMGEDIGADKYYYNLCLSFGQVNVKISK